ncbi:CD81 antigen isoform X2 [Macaca mulatta]
MLPDSRGSSGHCENQGSRADTWSLLGSQRAAQQGRRLLRLRMWGRHSPLGTCDTVPALSQLAGGVILGVALWLRHDPQTTNLLYLELGDKPAPNTFYVGIYILIAVGAVMMFVGFLGCYGAIQESQCLLGTVPSHSLPSFLPLATAWLQFFTCLVILFACEVAAGIWGFVNKDQIAKDVKQFYDQALQQAVVDDDANNAKAVVKTFHETLDCCGSSTLAALTTSVLKNNLCPSGSNIISNLLKKDCHQKIDELFSGKLYLIGIAAIVVAVIMIFEMILSMVLCCGIRNSSVY